MERNEKLETLIQEYYDYKQKLDDYKTICDEWNKEIKKIMVADNLSEYNDGIYVAQYVVQKRESINEDKLLKIAKDYELPVTKTVEVVDMEKLESLLYQNSLDDVILEKIASCKDTKEVPTLKVKYIGDK